MGELNYYDDEEVIKAFWSANIKQDYTDFDFIKAFEEFENPIYRKLAEHGLIDLDAYKEQEQEIYDYSCLDDLGTETNYISISGEDLMGAILEYKFNRMREAFKDYSAFDTLTEIYNKIQKAKNGETCLKEMVFLFDEVIHAQHETGNIFDDLEIEKLREEFEENLKIKELKGGINNNE